MLVSIITPSYNSERFISQTIESVIDQTYHHWELIIIDDGSPDNANQIIRKYIEQDDRIRLIKLERNQGVSFARNVGIDNANGKFIAFLDSDDIWLNTKLEKQVSFMQKHNHAISGTSYELINEENELLNKIIKAPKELTQRGYMKNTKIGFSSTMIDRTKIPDLNFVNLPVAEDYLFWAETLDKGYSLFGLDEVLMQYRVRRRSLSANKAKSAFQVFYINHKLLRLNLFVSLYYFVFYVMNAVYKRLGRSRP